MKELLFWLALIICVLILVSTLASHDINRCKRFGDDWRVSGYYDKYCTNENGDIKGL